MREAGGDSGAPESVTTAHAADRELLAALLASLDGMAFRGRIDDHWTMEFVSDGCAALTGYAPADLELNRRISYEQITHEGDRDRVRREILSALHDRSRYEVEYRIVRADGQVRWVNERGCGRFDEAGTLVALEGFVQDMSERKQADLRLQETERRYRGIFENAIEGLFQTTADGRILSVNPALARIYGYGSPEQLIEQMGNVAEQLYVRPGRRSEFMRLMELDGKVEGFESEIYQADGSIIWISESARSVCDEQGRLLFFEGTVEAITERKRYEQQMRYQATHDSLTGLPNREQFFQDLRGLLGFPGRRRRRGRITVGVLDLDQFKQINDALGHNVADQLLVLVASRIKHCLRTDDVAARQGGDEFMFILKGMTDADLGTVAERIMRTLAQPCRVGGRDVSVSCSIGFASSPEHGDDAEALLRKADVAMYKAKELGRNNYQCYVPEWQSGEAKPLDLVVQLQRALERNEFVLHYEPQWDLRSGRVVGVEALVRWQSERGLIGPGRFIALAENTGLILPIGLWVLRTACEQSRAWRDAGLAPIRVSVNLSRRQLIHGDIVGAVGDVLARSDLAPGDLQVEITESMVMKDGTRALDTVARLRALGVGVALDDFGTGYSNLSELKRLPISELKVDRSFVTDIDHDDSVLAIAETIIRLGQRLGLGVVAEGVETASQLARLRDLGCHVAQGYLLSRPLTAEQFSKLLQEPPLALLSGGLTGVA